MTFASSTGSVGGSGRGFARRTAFALIAAFALVAGLAFTSAASAVDGPPIVSPVTVDEVGYTTAKISGTIESEPYYGENNATLYCFEYSLLSEPLDDKTKWGGGTQACYSIFGPGGKAFLSDEFQNSNRIRPTGSASVLSMVSDRKGSPTDSAPNRTPPSPPNRSTNPAARWRSRTSPSTPPASRAPSKPTPRPARSTPPRKRPTEPSGKSSAGLPASSAPRLQRESSRVTRRASPSSGTPSASKPTPTTKSN